MNLLAAFCFLVATIAAAFLLYTVLNLEALGIGPSHPRVLVEAGLVVLFTLLGLTLVLT